MNQHKRGIFILLLCIIVLMPACSKRSQDMRLVGSNDTENEPKDSFRYGMMDTSIQEELGTKITLYNDGFKELSSDQYDYGSVGDFGYGVPTIKNGILYEFSLGFGYNKNYGTVLGIDLLLHDVKEYHFDRTNITETVITEDYIYVISNLNLTTYIDRYSFETSNIESYELQHFIGLDFCVCGDDIYTFDEEVDSYVMYKVNMDNQTCEEMYDLTKQCLEYEIRYIEVYQDSIYMLCDEELLQYSMKERTLKEINLSRNDAWGMYRYLNELYISCFDYYNEVGESEIFVYDMEQQEFRKEYSVPIGIMQLVVTEQSIIALDRNDTMYRYDFTDYGGIEFIRKVTNKVSKGRHTSGLIVW